MSSNKEKSVKILVELSNEENKIVEIYKTLNNLTTKQEAIKRIITDAQTSLVKGLKNGL